MRKETLGIFITVAMILATVNATLFAEVSNLREGIAEVELIRGEKGDTGEQGIAGINGTDGANGEKGDKGDRGNTGATGSSGSRGSAGTDGADGYNGVNGINGINGINGTNGFNGVNGSDFNGTVFIPTDINGSNEVLFKYGDDYYCYFATSGDARKSMLYRLRENAQYVTGDCVHFMIVNSVIVYL